MFYRLDPAWHMACRMEGWSWPGIRIFASFFVCPYRCSSSVYASHAVHLFAELPAKGGQGGITAELLAGYMAPVKILL